MTRPLRAIALGAVAVTACLDPTQATFEITTNVPCGPEGRAAGTLYETGLVAGTAAQVREAELQATSRGCTPGEVAHRIGDVVVYPEGDATEARALFVAGIGDARAEDCTAFARGDASSPFAASCVVARRRVAFVKNVDLQVPVFLDSACAGVPCDDDTTCRVEGGRATCIDAGVSCRGEACSIDVGDGTGGGSVVASSASTGPGGGTGGDGGSGGDGASGDAGGGGVAEGGGGSGGAGGGGGPGVEVVYDDPLAPMKLVTGLTDFDGAPGALHGVRTRDGADEVFEVGGDVIDLGSPPLAAVRVLEARTGAAGLVFAVASSDLIRRAPPAEQLGSFATDLAIGDDLSVIHVDGTVSLRTWSNGVDATAPLSGMVHTIDTFDGRQIVAAGPGSVCFVDGSSICVTSNVLGGPAVDVAVGPLGAQEAEALIITADGEAALFRSSPTGLFGLAPPTGDPVTLVRARVTVTGDGIDGAWIAGELDGGAYLARGVRLASTELEWTAIDTLAGEPPIVDLWVAPREGDVAYVVLADGRLLSVTLD